MRVRILAVLGVSFSLLYLAGCEGRQAISNAYSQVPQIQSAAQAKLHKAIDLSDSGQWQDALIILNGLADANSHELQVRFERAMVYLNLENTALAMSDLEYVYANDAKFPGAANWLAISKYDLGDFAGAGELKFSQLQSYDPAHGGANGQAWADCARYFLKASNPERALQVLNVYFEAYEGRQAGYEVYLPAPYHYKAKALLALDRPAEALAAADSAIELPHSTPSNKFMRIMALANSGQSEQAAAEFRALEPSYAGTAPFKEAAAEFERLGISFNP